MKIGNRKFELGKKTYIMGILNVTPDSFSDGGKFNNIDAAVAHALEMIEEDVDIIDIGGESTRPGHIAVSEEEELERIVPIIKEIRKHTDIPISIDTYKGKVAEEAIKAGASLINDVWGFKKDPYMSKVAAKYDVPCCLMHNRENQNYNNLIEDMIEDLKECVSIALSSGVKKENIILDPGVGFAKTYEDNLNVMRNLDRFKELGYSMLLGTSRKSLIGNTLNLPPKERVEGTIATTVIGVMNGYDFVRVHDVKENSRAALMADAIYRKK
ncbi:MAG: dihydropteroate synthase [Clostridium argentinense]|uniref:Dihydropteroate synthase n=1 Tax=Clostridium faecium TaxID=2762223 RepID=A0ABR8YMN4_9CLOT|nr:MULTISPECIES: dihydropteroate synthase [Clostridium]MBD8045509.1 dihydropteroate synthase [Clostridium faecium]MBS5824400.1 dihydropteroate synthase [Clostridium argentinense]MDU1348719.1 dihydropteroate synthase [Clostridium argentinense]